MEKMEGKFFRVIHQFSHHTRRKRLQYSQKPPAHFPWKRFRYKGEPESVSWEICTGNFPHQDLLTLQGICRKGCVVNDSRNITGKGPCPTYYPTHWNPQQFNQELYVKEAKSLYSRVSLKICRFASHHLHTLVPFIIHKLIQLVYHFTATTSSNKILRAAVQSFTGCNLDPLYWTDQMREEKKTRN